MRNRTNHHHHQQEWVRSPPTFRRGAQKRSKKVTRTRIQGIDYKITKQTSGDDVVMEITPEDREQAIAAGVPLARGRFWDRYPELAQKQVGKKVVVTMRLDPDIIQYFKARASGPGVAGYQTLINDTLRAAMQHQQGSDVNPTEVLLNDEGFISAVATKVAERVQRRLA